MSGLEPIGADVRRELGRFGPAVGMAEVVAAWPDAVGEQIALNAWPARLRFAVGHIPETGSDPAPKEKRTVPRVSEALSAEGERIAAAIEDPDLREVVARAAAASLATALAPPDRRSV